MQDGDTGWVGQGGLHQQNGGESPSVRPTKGSNVGPRAHAGILGTYSLALKGEMHVRGRKGVSGAPSWPQIPVPLFYPTWLPILSKEPG